MRPILQQFVHFFSSLRLTVVLLGLSIILVFAATLDQVHLGVWGIQHKWFQSFIVLQDIKGVPVPIFPGGYFIGWLLLINLITAHICRFKLTWKKFGIWLVHSGLILLLIGEGLTGLWSRESSMRLSDGQTKSYSESYRDNELAVIDATNPAYDDVVSIPGALLARGGEIQTPKLPFVVKPLAYYPNSVLQLRSQAPDAPPSPATTGAGPRLVAHPLAVTYTEDGHNLPTAYVQLVGPDGPLGTWLVSADLVEPQTFNYDGRVWKLALRPTRYYYPFSLTLEKFTHDRYAGTDIPKNFSSEIHLRSQDGRTDRAVRIYMNNPLRYAGLTFYQAGYENNDLTTILQVVRNPSWLIPYISCALMTLGLVIQFGLHLFGFFRKRRARAAAAVGV